MAEIRTIRTARKAYRCDSTITGHCHHTIRPGQRYLLTSLPPRGDLGNTGWWKLRSCAGCATRHGQALDEQATPRRSRPRTRPGRHAAQLGTTPSRPYHDEPPLDQDVIDVHLPAHDIA